MVLPHGRFQPELQPEARQERSLANRLHQVAADTKKTSFDYQLYGVCLCVCWSAAFNTRPYTE